MTTYDVYRTIFHEYAYSSTYEFEYSKKKICTRILIKL